MMKIHKITLPTPFAVGPVNVYLVEGEPLTLIDTGPRTDEAFHLLEQALSERGFRYGDLQRIIITHTHPDHFGLVKPIVEQSGAEIWTHPLNDEWFNTLDSAVMRRGLFMMQVFTQAGVPQAIMDDMARSGPRMGRMFETAPANHWLAEGDALEMGGMRWLTVHTPGHASGHISLYQPETQLMIAGDHLIKHISSNPLMEAPREYGQPRDKSLKLYIESMKRVAQMDVRLAYSGHGVDIADHRALIEERLLFHEARLEHIFHLLEGGGRTAYQLMRELFPKLTDFEVFLGLSEVIGHLDILQEQSRVVETQENGHLIYHQA